eukprot:11343377-Heterocapsa_arctica.AAC.1
MLPLGVNTEAACTKIASTTGRPAHQCHRPTCHKVCANTPCAPLPEGTNCAFCHDSTLSCVIYAERPCCQS